MRDSSLPDEKKVRYYRRVAKQVEGNKSDLSGLATCLAPHDLELAIEWAWKSIDPKNDGYYDLYDSLGKWHPPNNGYEALSRLRLGQLSDQDQVIAMLQRFAEKTPPKSRDDVSKTISELFIAKQQFHRAVESAQLIQNRHARANLLARIVALLFRAETLPREAE